MKAYRLNRLFHPVSRRCLDVALDHGYFNEANLLPGIEDLGRVVDTLVTAGSDAIQLTLGQAGLLQRHPGRDKPALALRVDVANVYSSEPQRTLFSRMLGNPVEQALRVDAACVVVNLFSIPDCPEVTDQCIENILRIKPECERMAMPLMIEPLLFRSKAAAGGYLADGEVKRTAALVRQAVELGADILKADPTDSPERYGEIVEAAGSIPVLVRGGQKEPDKVVLERSETFLNAGASGFVYGRNIFQHHDPVGMTRALLALLHEGAPAREAARRIRPQP